MTNLERILSMLWVCSQIDGQYNNIESHSLLFISSAGSRLLSSSLHVVGYILNKSTFVIYAPRAHSSAKHSDRACSPTSQKAENGGPLTPMS